MVSVKAIIFRVWYYYVLAIGFSSLYYDYRQRRLLSPRWLRCYSFLARSLLLLFLPFYYLEGLQYLDVLVEKPVLQYVSGFNVRLQTIVVLYTIAMRRRHENDFYKIVQHLRRLERSYFNNWTDEVVTANDCDRLFYAKLLTLCLQNAMIMMSCAIVIGKRQLTLSDYILNVYCFIIWNYLQSTVFTYFLTLLHISRRYGVLNAYLRRRLLWRLNASEHNVSVATLDIWLAELQTVLQVHGRLQAIVVQLNNLCRLHITSLLLTFFLSNTATFYIAFISLANWSTKHVFVVMTFLLFAIKSFDVFLINQCCVVLVAAQGKVLELFQQHQHRMDMCAEYERMCVDFGLKAALSKFSINIYGMFDIDHRATFAALRNTLMHALILIQFDYIVDAQGKDGYKKL